jgi:hypothetical protein
MSEVLIFPSKSDDHDKEITVIANLVAILGQCEPAQRIRILRYLHSLYSIPLIPPAPPPFLRQD